MIVVYLSFKKKRKKEIASSHPIITCTQKQTEYFSNEIIISTSRKNASMTTEGCHGD